MFALSHALLAKPYSVLGVESPVQADCTP
jgi:hypothetical protein